MNPNPNCPNCKGKNVDVKTRTYAACPQCWQQEVKEAAPLKPDASTLNAGRDARLDPDEDQDESEEDDLSDQAMALVLAEDADPDSDKAPWPSLEYQGHLIQCKRLCNGLRKFLIDGGKKIFNRLTRRDGLIHSLWLIEKM